MKVYKGVESSSAHVVFWTVIRILSVYIKCPISPNITARRACRGKRSFDVIHRAVSEAS